MEITAGFVRYQATEVNRHGNRVGIFALANSLARGGELSSRDYQWWRAANEWYDAAYPDPSSTDPGVYDHGVNPHAQAWFKTTAGDLLARIPGYLDLLNRYGVPYEELQSSSPGRILYEDDVQIVVDPYRWQEAVAAAGPGYRRQ